MVITAEESRATIETHPGGVTEALKNGAAVDADNPTNPERDAAIKSTTDRYLAVAFLLGADRFRYGTLVEEMKTNTYETRAAQILPVHTPPLSQRPTTTFATIKRTQRTSRGYWDKTTGTTLALA
jgi:hypothetical protein